MKILHIDVRDKIATYRSRDGEIVCGNTDYRIQFSLDDEWEGLEKTARFIWNGQYFDTPLLDDDSCIVPVISNAEAVVVGLYAENLHTTTSAIIYCKRSILCGDVDPNPGTGLNYTTEAQKAAKEASASATTAQYYAGQSASRATEAINAANTATAAADTAKAAAATVATLAPKIEHNSNRITSIEGKLNIDNDIVKVVRGYTTSTIYGNPDPAVNGNMYRYIRILKLGSKGTVDYNSEYGFYSYVKGYIDRIGSVDPIYFTSKQFKNCPDYGVGNCDSDRYANYIFFEGGKAYYHQGCRLYEDYSKAVLADGEIMINEWYGDGKYVCVIGLVEPIITDISADIEFNGVYDLGELRYNNMPGDYGNAGVYFYNNGYYEFAYMTKEGV